MAEILEINQSTAKIGDDAGKIVELPIATLRFSDPKVGDQVRVYKDDEDAVIVSRVAEKPAATETIDASDRRHINKIAYILVIFFVGFLGVHRFMRGQVGLGLLMLFIGWWITLGIWPLVDFIISLIKISQYPGDDFVFTPDGRFTK